MKNEIACCDMILLSKEGKILLLLRTEKDKLFPNKWCLPGGHVEEGETLGFAAIRETYEETGILCEKCIKLQDYTYPDGFETTFFYAIEDKHFKMKEVSLSLSEHKSYIWINPSEIDDYDLAGDLPNAIKEISKNILNK